jgi:hypothetical protein
MRLGSTFMYGTRLKSPWTHLITPSRNFAELRWTSLFRSTSLGKRWTSYNAPPTSRKRAADRWSLRNFLPRSSLFIVGKAQKLQGGRYELIFVFGWEKVDRWNPIRTSAIQFKSRLMRFLDFSNHENGALRQEISKWSTVCSAFSRSGWSVERSASLAKWGTSKKRPSPHLHEVPPRSNKVNPRTFQTALVQFLDWHPMPACGHAEFSIDESNQSLLMSVLECTDSWGFHRQHQPVF